MEILENNVDVWVINMRIGDYYLVVDDYQVENCLKVGQLYLVICNLVVGFISIVILINDEYNLYL